MRGVHAGEEKLIWNQPAVRSAPETIVLSSSAFEDGSAMPTRFAAGSKGENQSPPFEWSNLPNGTAEIVLVMEDPDAPLPFTSMHLVVTGISPRTNGLPGRIPEWRRAIIAVSAGKGIDGKTRVLWPKATPVSWPPSLCIPNFRARSNAQNRCCFRSKNSAERNRRPSSGPRSADRYF